MRRRREGVDYARWGLASPEPEKHQSLVAGGSWRLDGEGETHGYFIVRKGWGSKGEGYPKLGLPRREQKGLVIMDNLALDQVERREGGVPRNKA